VDEEVRMFIERIRKRVHPMLKVRFAGLVLSVGIVALVAGCPGPSAKIASDASGPVAAAFAPASDFTGTWRGSFGQGTWTGTVSRKLEREGSTG
jgi:hypothetical protein